MNNSNLLFRKRGKYEQLMSLTEIESMTPFEREVYLIQINNKIKKENQNKQGAN